MDDRELLERAARAAGIELWWRGGKSITNATGYWNPLKDDGDAILLGVEMDMFDESSRLATSFQWYLAVEMGKTSDKFAATRRAIVITAAESACEKHKEKA